MDNYFLDKFKDYIRDNYNKSDLTGSVICSNIHCSRDTLRRTVLHKYNYSTMRYVEYIRVLKAMEIVYKGNKKVYCHVGYNSDVVFSSLI